jgi:hypothetical protein
MCCRGAHGVDVVVVCDVAPVAVVADAAVPDEADDEVDADAAADAVADAEPEPGVTFGVGNGFDNETYGSSITCAGRTMCNCPDAAATMRDGVSNSDTASSA